MFLFYLVDIPTLQYFYNLGLQVFKFDNFLRMVRKVGNIAKLTYSFASDTESSASERE